MTVMRGETGTRRDAAPGEADWLGRAAAPTFAVMALLSYVTGGGADMVCSVGQDASPLSGMMAMYMLMSVFHLTPWLKLVSRHRSIGQLSQDEQRYSGR